MQMSLFGTCPRHSWHQGQDGPGYRCRRWIFYAGCPAAHSLFVVIGWIMGNDCITLDFDGFQVAVMFVAVLLVNYLTADVSVSPVYIMLSNGKNMKTNLVRVNPTGLKA